MLLGATLGLMSESGNCTYAVSAVQRKQNDKKGKVTPVAAFDFRCAALRQRVSPRVWPLTLVCAVGALILQAAVVVVRQLNFCRRPIMWRLAPPVAGCSIPTTAIPHAPSKVIQLGRCTITLAGKGLHAACFAVQAKVGVSHHDDRVGCSSLGRVRLETAAYTQ